MPKKSFQTTTSSQMSQLFFVCFSVNILVLYFSNLLAPNFVVFGAQFVPATWALFLSMAVLSLINLLAVPIFEVIQEEKQKELSPKEWMIGYFIVNFTGLWLISRFAEQFGLGFSSWVVVALVALVLDFVQGFAIMKFVYPKNN